MNPNRLNGEIKKPNQKRNLVIAAAFLAVLSFCCFGGGIIFLLTTTLENNISSPPNTSSNKDNNSNTSVPNTFPSPSPSLRPTVTPGKSPTPTITNTNTPQPTPENLADRIRDQMETGGVAYNPPAKMNLEDTKLVELVLNPSQKGEEVAKSLPDEQGTRQILSDDIKWHGVMQADMTGTDFEITPVTETKQRISRRDRTKWSWLIKPKKPGKQKLFLKLYALVTDDGIEHPLPIIDYDPKEIEVDVTLIQRTGLFLSAVGSHMEWILTAVIGILIPFGFWLWRRGKEKNDEETKDDAEEKDTAEQKGKAKAAKSKKQSKQKPPGR
jgi:hypothetical protein